MAVNKTLCDHSPLTSRNQSSHRRLAISASFPLLPTTYAAVEAQQGRLLDQGDENGLPFAAVVHMTSLLQTGAKGKTAKAAQIDLIRRALEEYKNGEADH